MMAFPISRAVWKGFEITEQDGIAQHRRFEIVVPKIQLDIIKREISENGSAVYSFLSDLECSNAEQRLETISRGDKLVFILTSSGCWGKSPLARAGPYEVNEVITNYGEKPGWMIVHYSSTKTQG